MWGSALGLVKSCSGIGKESGVSWRNSQEWKIEPVIFAAVTQVIFFFPKKLVNIYLSVCVQNQQHFFPSSSSLIVHF